ncbi:MAG: Gfo/Idh/MocA family oxidoreductase [Actinocatenispora sp.]
MTVRFGIVGCGVISGTHARAIGQPSNDAHLMAVTDVVPDRAAAFAAEQGVAHAADLDELLAREDVDAVAVCVPSGAHADVAVRALDAGKHVVVEKPADISLADIDRIIAARDRSGRLVTSISQHRFDPASQVVHEAVSAGRFGRLTSGSAAVNWWRSQSYYDSGDWRGTWALDGGGALMNQGIHTLDLLCWLLGEPVEVFAFSGLLAHERIEVEDTAVAAVRFASGALGTVLGTTAAHPGLTTRLHVHGTTGSAVIDNDRLDYFHVAAGDTGGPAYGASGADNQADQVLPGGGASGSGAGSDPGALSDAHSVQYQDFLAALTGDRAPLVTLEEGRRAVGLILAIYESSRTGRPVTIGERA